MEYSKKTKKKKFVDVQRWKYLIEKEPKEEIEEGLENFLIQTIREYRKNRLRTFKEWIKLVRKLLDELD